MRVMVTGGAGYIGSHVCKALAQAGFEPITFDNFTTGHRWAVRWGPLVEADLCEPAAIREALRHYSIGAVVHMAASIAVGESIVNPRKYFENNTRNTLNLLGAMLDERVGRLIVSSTAAVYGNPENVPIAESHPYRPVSPYGESKLLIEKMLDWYGKAYGLRCAVLRYFNAAGADPDGEVGEAHNPETHLIPLAIEAALGRSSHLKIFGADYPTPDGTPVRDYIHVSDLANAHLAALRHLLNGGASITANVGSGQGYSVREVLIEVERVCGQPVPVQIVERRAGDPPVLVASPAYARQVLGWEPQFSALNSIVATAWHWHEVHGREGAT